MTQDEIIEMARQAGVNDDEITFEFSQYRHLERFAELIAAEAIKQRTWIGLTDKEIKKGIQQSWVTEQAFQSAVWWAEAKLKEKNS